MNYRKKLLLAFLAIFFVYALVIVGLQIQKEKEYQTESQKGVLHTYSMMTEKMLCDSISEDSILAFLPSDVRLSVIGKEGRLIYDNVSDNLSENHFGRPEVSVARLSGEGYAIRESASTGREYLYYARQEKDGTFLRLALPYVIRWLDFVHGSNVMLYVVVFLFFITLLILVLMTDKFGNVMQTLTDFATNAEKGHVDYSNVHFPDTYSGEIGQKIISLYQQLEKSKEQTILEKDRNRLMKQEMTNNIAHELKTPVSSIRGYLELLLEKTDITPEKQRYFLERSYAQTLRLSDLIQDVSLITKLEESSELFPKEKLDVKAVFEEAAAEWSEAFQEKRIIVEDRLPTKMFLAGNHSLLFAIFRNLIENVVKHAGSGISIVVECIDTNNLEYRLRFYDTGTGVQDSYLEKIFDRFVRIDTGRSRKNGGTGLGLAIVKHAVQFHGGTIKASNRTEGGLSFEFTLSKGYQEN